jgi:multidrug efflux system membrane fusion protein
VQTMRAERIGRRRWWLGLCALAMLAAGAVILFHLFSGPASSGQRSPPPVPVVTARVASGDVPIELEAIGRVTAFNIITVRTLVGGQIQTIAFKDGQTVKQGDLLVQIDPRLLQATVDQDKGVVERDRANLANAQADLKRYVPLVGGGLVSVQQTQTQRALVAQLQGTLGADLAALARDQVELGYTRITAPLSGILGLRLVDVGNVVEPSNQTGLVVLTQVQPITVLFALPQTNLPDIQDSLSAAKGADLATQAWTADDAHELDQGELSALSNVVDSANGSLTLKAVFPNKKQNLWPGESVNVRLVLGIQHEGLTVPVAAIDQGPQGPFVWVLSSDGTARPTPVVIRQQLHGQALVTSGLQAGETVVINGQYGLTSGAHVAVQAAQAQSPGGTNGSVPLSTNQPNRLGIAP